GEALSTVRLHAVIGGKSLQFTPAGGSPSAAFDIPKGGLVEVDVTATDPLPGDHTGDLVASTADSVATVAQIATKRSLGAVLSIAGAKAEGLSFSRTSTDSTLPIEIDSSASDVVKVRVRVSPFTDVTSNS